MIDDRSYALHIERGCNFIKEKVGGFEQQSSGKSRPLSLAL